MDQQSPPQLLECSQKEAALLYEKNRYKEVENIYSKLIGHLSQIHDGSSQDVKKTLAVAYNNRGHSKYMQVCFDDAIEDYNEALHYDDALAVSYYNRGTIRYRLCVGMSEEGDAKLELLCVMLQDFKNASTIDPDNLEYKIGLANAEKEYENLSGMYYGELH